jgi:hypothetical protein
MEAIAEGKDVDEAIKEMDDLSDTSQNDELAVEDFRREISVLKSLRHPYVHRQKSLLNLINRTYFVSPFYLSFLSKQSDCADASLLHDGELRMHHFGADEMFSLGCIQVTHRARNKDEPKKSDRLCHTAFSGNELFTHL